MGGIIKNVVKVIPGVALADEVVKTVDGGKDPLDILVKITTKDDLKTVQDIAVVIQDVKSAVKPNV